MKIDGAIFDMDGTLVDSLIVWDFMWSEMGRMYLGDESFRPSREADKAVRTMILSDAMEYI
ncbi:MAG: bifunctional hydroxymethylpyrimidine kinase/phosphomethylpyrimidine kinase, partial [Clostridia bacterium]|nr:bifunctional hydroxymethylpyrimidine kinase/phosphomethylpyrimidine kinase [Clostridia bacterium]